MISKISLMKHNERIKLIKIKTAPCELLVSESSKQNLRDHDS